MKSINLSTIDLNLLVAFEALLTHRSVTGAATKLQIGQPAMSAALSRLRALFDDELFVRIGRQMQPTLKAQAIAPGILAALHHVRQTLASSQVFDPTSSDREFAIGSADYTSFLLLPSLMALSHDAAPGIDFRMIEFEKDSVGELLEQGAVDVALGVFPNPPRQTLCEPLFEERFVGIARQGHPALTSDNTMSLDKFVALSHGLTTLRRDAVGELDKTLRAKNMTRRIAFTTPHMLVLPFAIASSDVVAAVPYRLAQRMADVCKLALFDLPIPTTAWTISMLWSVLSDQDEANRWLRNTLKTACTPNP